MKRENIDTFFARLQAENPHPKSELNYTNAYTLLVAVTLSAQATDISVNIATEKLFQIVKTPEDMLKLGEAGLKDHIKTIGLFNAKAKNVIAQAAMLVDSFGSQVPDTREELVQLPGVGRKTANVVLNVIFGQPTMAVDTHIFRLGNRLKIATGKTPEEVEKKLVKVIPSKYMQHAHHWLILHGRYICKARSPLCEKCIVYDLCDAKEKKKLDEPFIPKKLKSTKPVKKKQD